MEPTPQPPDRRPTGLAPRHAALLFVFVVLAWGLNWPVLKAIVESVPPLWVTMLRSWLAFFTLLPIMAASGNLIVPTRRDVPFVLCIALLHMVGFSALVTVGLQFVPAGTAVVLAYTTPLWVAISAPLVLGEKLTAGKAAGVGLGLAGLALIFNPLAMDWGDTRFLFGTATLLLAAISWAASIIFVRSRHWTASSFQLLIWQVLVAAIVLSIAAPIVEGWPTIHWTPQLVLLLLYGGLFGTTLGYWAMSIVNRSLPALTTSLGVMATPVVGIASAALTLGERIQPALVWATALIIAGVAVGLWAGARRPPR